MPGINQWIDNGPAAQPKQLLEARASASLAEDDDGMRKRISENQSLCWRLECGHCPFCSRMSSLLKQCSLLALVVLSAMDIENWLVAGQQSETIPSLLVSLSPICVF
jgi:hypothetical protein